MRTQTAVPLWIQGLVVLAGLPLVVALALDALRGREQSEHARYWMVRANGDFTFMCRGLASIFVALFVVLFLILTSAAFDRFGQRAPAAASGVRQVIRGIMLFLAIAFVAVLILQPIA
jgi:hypothetical protein